MDYIKSFIKDEDAIGVVEIILILVGILTPYGIHRRVYHYI